MMEHATRRYPGKREGRWVVEAQFRRRQWKGVVEPILEKERLVVVTGYRVEKLK